MARADVINKAKSYIKYWGNPNPFTKWYCKDNKTHAWCGMFVKYVFKKGLNSNMLDKCSNFAYVPTIVSWAKKMGYWTTDWKKAEAGDLVVYDWYPVEHPNWYYHVGIVKKKTSTGIQSIEGNTTNGNQSDWVALKTRNKKYVAGIIKLPYKKETAPTKPKATYYIVKKGDTLSSIAKKYKTTWKNLYKLNKTLIDNDAKKNGIKKNFYNHIYAGQKLRVK